MRRQGGRNKVNCVEDGTDDEYAFTVGFSESCDRNGSETVGLQVEGVILSGVLIDSGSSCNIIDKATWEELKHQRYQVQVREGKSEVVSLLNSRTFEELWESLKHP